MSDPKYANLPGIDTEKDVYEAGDLPEEDQQWAPEELQSDSIEKININTSAVFQKFNSKFVSGNNVDFSGKLGSQLGYEVGDFTSCGSDDLETPTQKVERLKMEISQLSDEAKSSQKEDTTAADLLLKLGELQNFLPSKNQGDQSKITSTYDRIISTLDELALDKSEHKQVKGQETAGSYNLLIKRDQALQKYTAKVSEIEQRLVNIEKAVGIDTDQLGVLSSQTKYKSLREAVEALEIKRNLLDPEKLPQVDTRLQAVLNKLNEINKSQKQEGAEQAATDAKVVELYETVHKWESVYSSLPSIINRLETLNDLHQQASDFVQTLNHMDEVQAKIMSSLDSTQASVTEVKNAFMQNIKTIHSNLQSLEKRMGNLAMNQ